MKLEREFLIVLEGIYFLVHTITADQSSPSHHGLTMFRFLLLGSLWVAAVCRAQFFTMPDTLHNYTDMISFITQRLKYMPRTTTKRLNCTPGEDEHFDYMMDKYERDFGSQIKDEDFTLPFTLLTTTGASPANQEAQWAGMTHQQEPPHDLLEGTEGTTEAVTPREITVTELVTGLIDETFEPEHKVLQMIKELAHKGLRVYAKLKDINTEQKEEHFPWKYMTEHREYQEAATRPPPSPVTFENDEAKASFKNKTEERVVQNLMSVLRDCLDAGEEKKKEILKRTTPTSAEQEQMREYYRQTKQDAQPEYKDYTTWDGGERHLTLTPSSVEREILPKQTFKKYDTLEIYHDAKAKEEEAMELEEYENGVRLSTTTTEKPVDFNGTITINWAAMSEVMWHYISQVTLPASVLHSPHTTHTGGHARVLEGEVHQQKGHMLQNSTMISTLQTEENNQLLEDYLKYLTEVGQTIEPDPRTTNFLVERFPKRLSSDEVAQKKLYSKSPHFVEKFARRLDSVEMKKRQSRLSTTPTTTTATWAYTTFHTRTFNSKERERIEEFFQMNNISSDPEYFGTTTTVPITTSRVTIQTGIDHSSTEQTSRKETLSQDGMQKGRRTTTDTKDKVGDEEKEIYKHIDVPQIQSNEKLMLTTKNRTMSYHELSSVVSYYAELLRMKEGKSLYFSTSSPVKIFTTQRTEMVITPNIIAVPEVTTTKIKTTKRTVELAHEDAHAMTEAPMQHVFNLLFNPFRHDVMTQTPCSPVNIEDDNLNDLVKSLGSTLGTEHFNSSEDNQLQEPNMITTPRVYSKGDVYAMGYKQYLHGDHDPMWRSNYGGYESTTTTKSDLLNIFDDPLGLYMRPDTEELKERELNETLQRQEAEAKLDNITHYAYWKELNRKYFNLTSTIFPGQLTQEKENQTPRMKEKTIETIYSEEHYIETQSTTPAQDWTGYHLENETMDPFPDAQEIANQLGKRHRDPLDPEHMLEKRLMERELEDQVELNEDDMPNQSYMNMSFSDQLCVDRAPAFRFFDDSQQFESEGFKTMEGFHSKSYEFLEKAINREVELTRQRFAERAYNKTLDEIERRRTRTTPGSMEKQGLRMDNIKFRHLDDQYQAGDMDDFKVKLKQQLGGIYARPSTTTTLPTTHLLVITNKGGKVIRRLKKIKRRKHVTHTHTLNNNIPHNNHGHDREHNELKAE
uniref:Uncharacterized protein n=1 Tax=Cacopsylla melanoneura TaxID=428564 RepID=A0A8D8XCV3_9HEMI